VTLNNFEAKILTIFLILFPSSFSLIFSKTKEAQNVFKKWISDGDFHQYVFKDIPISTMCNKLNSQFTNTFNSLTTDKHNAQHLLMRVFHIKPEQEFTLNEKNINILTQIYNSLDTDINNFFQILISNKNSGLSLNKNEEKENFLTILDKYTSFMSLILANNNWDEIYNYYFSLANRFFEYSFGEKNWDNFKKYLIDPALWPITRLVYSTLWRTLSGFGWKDWAQETLNALTYETSQGNTIVYIAGGCDVYQLLRHNINNIEVIDPILPTQPKYYIKNWHWFIKENSKNNGIGDTFILITKDNKKLTLKRTSYKTYGNFTATLSSNKKITLPKSITRWDVYNNLNKKIGHVTFKRRFCKQKDFDPAPNKKLLISFNELYFITTKDRSDSWGIDPTKFYKNTKIYVKQLRTPVTKKVLCHLCAADRLPFSFIKLGTCIN
jgi:hypothetical protein